MTRVRSVVLQMELCVSKKSNNRCAHDRKNHPVPRGATWLKVTSAGSPGTSKYYCVPCAQKILRQAHETITGLLAELDEDPQDTTPRS